MKKNYGCQQRLISNGEVCSVFNVSSRSKFGMWNTDAAPKSATVHSLPRYAQCYERPCQHQRTDKTDNEQTYTRIKIVTLRNGTKRDYG